MRYFTKLAGVIISEIVDMREDGRIDETLES
jgi:hypothetical protein